MRESTASGDTKVLGYPATTSTTSSHRHHHTRITATPRYPHQQQQLHRSTTNNAEIVSLPSMNIEMPENMITRSSPCNSISSSSMSSSSSSNGSAIAITGHHNLRSNTSSPSSKSSSSSSSSSHAFQAQWLFFSNSRWIPLDTQSHSKLERTLQLGGVFVDIQDSHFPDVQRIRVFPGADYLSYLGIRYRISRVLLPAL
ncbi:hypothetical protein BDB00DRAFT_834492 [Zychaea mexicana]|uniref:uncharacterized protein n=1 Tax=Zychaea mexicana TaxID=64656 RepID=UPI0022FEF20D|nr:uncharacterized protein BDB00DRAFT_834492 [Zychaea mexicana]KAI9491096.1 hypothetical protein BDB00DRAFT_834492 [Zychaea mexicana]